MKTLLIFACECAPYHRPGSTIGAQRPAQFAKHLPEFGWRAIVLCCDIRARGRGMAPDLLEDVSHQVAEAGPSASVIVPLPSLPADGIIDRLWWLVQREPEARRDGAIRRWLRKPLTMAKLATGDYSQAWQPCARQAAEVVAATTRVDACLGEHSPDAGIFLARWFAATYGVPWVADFRDQVLAPFSRATRFVYRPIVRRLVATAARTIDVTPHWSAVDGELFGRPSVTIPNGFDEDEFAEHPASPNDRFTISYLGGVKAEMQLACFLDGLRVLREQRGPHLQNELQFVYRGFGDHEVARDAREAGVSDLVDSGPAVPRSEAIALMMRADMLLLLSGATPPKENPYLAYGYYPGKTFEYFGARRPILCVPGDNGDLDELIRRTRTGSIVGDPTAIAAHLADAIAAWKQNGAVPYEPVAEQVARYTRRALTGSLARLLDDVVADGALTAMRPRSAGGAPSLKKVRR